MEFVIHTTYTDGDEPDVEFMNLEQVCSVLNENIDWLKENEFSESSINEGFHLLNKGLDEMKPKGHWSWYVELDAMHGKWITITRIA